MEKTMISHTATLVLMPRRTGRARRTRTAHATARHGPARDRVESEAVGESRGGERVCAPEHMSLIHTVTDIYDC